MFRTGPSRSAGFGSEEDLDGAHDGVELARVAGDLVAVLEQRHDTVPARWEQDRLHGRPRDPTEVGAGGRDDVDAVGQVAGARVRVVGRPGGGAHDRVDARAAVDDALRIGDHVGRLGQLDRRGGAGRVAGAVHVDGDVVAVLVHRGPRRRGRGRGGGRGDECGGARDGNGGGDTAGDLL